MALTRATFSRRRRATIALNVLVASLLAPLAGGLVLYLAFRPGLRQRADLTQGSVYSLSERSERVLADLPDGVEIFSCFLPDDYNSSGLPVPGLGQVVQIIAQHTNDLLREYELTSRGKLQVHLYDPYKTGHLARIDELSQEIGQRARNVVLVRHGDRRRILRLDDLAEYDEGPKATEAWRRPRLLAFRDEQALTSALLSVTEERPRRVRFLHGHGERNPDSRGLDAAGRAGLDRLRRRLEAQNFDVGILEADAPLTPEEVDILVVASPTQPLAEREVERLVRYAREGGKMLLLFDPDSSIDLDFPLLDQVYGLQRLPALVCQATFASGWMRQPDTFDVTRYAADAELVRPHRAQKLRTLWYRACAFRPIGRREQGELEVTPLIWTEDDAWQDLPDADGMLNLAFDPATETQQAWTLGVSVRTPADGRAVVLGDSHLLDDHFIDQATGNADLGLNAVEWLAEREQLISISPRPYDEIRVDLSDAEFQTVLFYVAGGIPGLALLLAVAVFWNRRS